MNKKLIALAIASAVSMPVLADTSNVTIYGTLDVGVDDASNVTAAGGTNNVGRFADYGSFLGLKGSENVGNGVSAIWQIEQGLSLSGGNNASYNLNGHTGFAQNPYNNQRNSFVGLSSTTAGTILGGIHDTPYKMATASMDPFADTLGDYNGIVGAAGSYGMSASNYFDLRPTNTLAYVSPNLNGLTLAGAYVFGDATNTNPAGLVNNMNGTAAANSTGDAYSIAAMYNLGPAYLTAAYEKHNFGAGGNGSLGYTPLAGLSNDAWKLGASYSVMDLTLSLMYEDSNDNFGPGGGNLVGHHTWYGSAKYKMGAYDVALAYANAGSGAQSNTGADQYTIGGDYNFSKNTQAFLLYTRIANDSNAYYNFADTTAPVAGGGYYDPNTGVFSGVAGATISAVSLGIKHSF